MDIRKEVQRRIADLTRFAYERGYRDGAQSALAEIESMATDDVVEHLAADLTPPKAIGDKKTTNSPPKKRARKPVRATKSKQAKSDQARGKPKTIVVQETLQSLLAVDGQVRRDQVLKAAQAENPAITKFDLGNGLRALIKQSKVRVSPDDSSILLPH